MEQPVSNKQKLLYALSVVGTVFASLCFSLMTYKKAAIYDIFSDAGLLKDYKLLSCFILLSASLTAIVSLVFKGGHKELRQTLNGKKAFLYYMLFYTALFIMIQAVVFSDFYQSGRTFVWQTDGIRGYFPQLIYINKELPFPLYDWRLSPAETNTETEPIQWLAALWPSDKLDVLYDILVILRYYLIGVSFSFMGFYFKQEPLPVMIGAFSYIFCGFGLYAGVRHPWFMAPMIFLPLLITGAEKIIRNENAWIFTAAVFLSLISSLYFSCMLAIMTVIFLLVRYFFGGVKRNAKDFSGFIGRTALYGGTAVLLSGAVMLPALFHTIDTGRIGRTVFFSLSDYFKYPTEFYKTCLAGLTLIPGNLGNWTCLGFSVLSVPAIILLFRDKRPAAKSIKIIFVVFTLMWCIPASTYVLSGFNAFSNRWMFGYALVISMILMFELPELRNMNKKTLAAVCAGSVIYILLCCFAVPKDLYQAAPMVFLAVSSALLALCRIAEKKLTVNILYVCLAITCVSVCFSGFLMYDQTTGGYASEFIPDGSVYAEIERGQYYSLGSSSSVKNDADHFRSEAGAAIKNEVAAGHYSGVSAWSYYTSSVYPSFRQLYEKLEVRQRGDWNLNFGMYGSPALLTLSNVKYCAVRKWSGTPVPYGFEFIDRIENYENYDDILENKYFLPIGYTYDSVIPMSECEGMNGLRLQEVMLQSAIVDDSDVSGNRKTSEDISFASEKLPYETELGDGASRENGRMNITEKKAKMTLKFDGIPNADTYLRIVGLDLTSGTEVIKWNLNVSDDDISINGNFAADAYMYANGAKTQIFCLGSKEDGFKYCTLTFPQEGSFALEDLEIWCMPMDNYGAQVGKLREESLENIKTNSRGLAGTIRTSSDKFLCFAIPYDKGWTAYVDGVKTELVQANIGFTGLYLPAGEHSVELKYSLTGLTAGIVMSCSGAVCIIAVVIIKLRRKSSEKNKNGMKG